MACKTLHELKTSTVKEVQNIKARVLRLWDGTILSTGEIISLDMILIDEEGTMMHGVINKSYIENFRSLIEEGIVCIITNLRVTAALRFRPVDSDKIINFKPTTNVEKLEDTDEIPKYAFNFLNLVMLSTKIGNDTYLSDIIGAAAHIGPIEETTTFYGLSKMRDIFLLIEHEEVKVRLWGSKADLIDVNSAGQVIIVTSTTVKKFANKHPPEF